MAYRIKKQTDTHLKLSGLNTAGYIFQLILLSVGILFVSLAVYAYFSESKFEWLFIVFGFAFIYGGVKNNNVSIDAKEQSITFTRTLLGIVVSRSTVKKHQLSLVEISGVEQNYFSSVIAPEKSAYTDYYLKFYSIPEMVLSFASLSDLLRVANFLEEKFETKMAIIQEHSRKDFSFNAFSKIAGSDTVSQSEFVKEVSSLSLRILSSPIKSFRFYFFLIGYFTVCAGMFLLSNVVFDNYLHDISFYRYLAPSLFCFFCLWFVLIVLGERKLTLSGNKLLVSRQGLTDKSFNTQDIWGCAIIARQIFLLTKKGSVKLSYNIHPKYCSEIQGWLNRKIKG